MEDGRTATYGSLTSLNSALTTSHSGAVSGLLASRTYHYRVLSRGQDGLLATSPDSTFTTPAPSADIQGQWSSVITWPLVAVHAAVVPTGDVVMWDAWETPGTPSGRLWNPTTQTFTSVPVPMSALFCAGQTYLADGRPIVIGGHHGSDIIGDTTLDPSTNSRLALAPMNYPVDPIAIAGDGRLARWRSPWSLADVPEVYNRHEHLTTLPVSLWHQMVSRRSSLPMAKSSSWRVEIRSPGSLTLERRPGAPSARVRSRAAPTRCIARAR